MPYHVAIVEDETSLRQNYLDALSRQGYQVSGYAERNAASLAFRNKLPDLVILDIGLMHESEGGFELCRELRTASATLPIIFLTARDNDLDTISGLRLGADDYLTKDISLAHLSARIAALFRRTEALRAPSDVQDIIRRGSLTLDMNLMSASWQEQHVDLTLTELWVVYVLSKRSGHVKSREQIMDAANIVVDDTTITSHIKRIRRKFRQVDDRFDSIETVYGMGYRWVEA